MTYLQAYPHYLLYLSSSDSDPLTVLTLVAAVVQLAVTTYGMLRYLPRGLPCDHDLVAFYSWCFSASLVLVGAAVKGAGTPQRACHLCRRDASCILRMVAHLLRRAYRPYPSSLRAASDLNPTNSAV